MSGINWASCHFCGASASPRPHVRFRRCYRVGTERCRRSALQRGLSAIGAFPVVGVLKNRWDRTRGAAGVVRAARFALLRAAFRRRGFLSLGSTIVLVYVLHRTVGFGFTSTVPTEPLQDCEGMIRRLRTNEEPASPHTPHVFPAWTGSDPTLPLWALAFSPATEGEDKKGWWLCRTVPGEPRAVRGCGKGLVLSADASHHLLGRWNGKWKT